MLIRTRHRELLQTPSIRTALPLLLALLTLPLLHSCCRHNKIGIEEKEAIVIGTPTLDNTKAAINSLDALKESEREFGVYGYKKRETAPSTYEFTRTFNNTPVGYDSNSLTWTYTPTRYWDSNPKVFYYFFAYWPHVASAQANGEPWVSEKTDISQISSTEHMGIIINDIPNYQDAADNASRDFLTSKKQGQYKSLTDEHPTFESRTVTFDFSHILSKLIIQGYYVGEQSNHVKVHNLTLSGTGILAAGGTSDYTSTLASQSFTNISKGTGQQVVSQVLYNNNQGCQILENAFKENDNSTYTPTPVCEWLLVPTDGWSDLTLSVTYAIGTAQAQTNEVANIAIGTGENHIMEPGKTYILNLMFDTQGGIQLETMWISQWIDVTGSREIYNW